MKSTQLLAILAILILTPFAIIDFLHGKHLLATGISLIIAAILYSSWCIRRNSYNPTFTYRIIMPALLLLLLYAFHSLGLKAALWLYPSVIVLYLIMPERMAMISNGILLCAASLLALAILDAEIALRLIASLLAVSLFIVVFIRVILSQQTELQALATTDPLTGLLNRSSLDGELDMAIAQSRRAGIPMTLVSMDLDFFKQVNDRGGHGAGDEVLKRVADLFRERCRATDLKFRIGGEEFLLLMFNTGPEGGLLIAEALREAIDRQPDIPISASFGVATYQHGESREAWEKRADKKLYQAKSEGRNRVVG